MFYFVF